MGHQFEYQIYRSDYITEEKLKQMGKGGWQLQTIHTPDLKLGVPNIYYFMRETDASCKCRYSGSTRKAIPEAKPVSTSSKRGSGQSGAPKRVPARSKAAGTSGVRSGSKSRAAEGSGLGTRSGRISGNKD